MYLFLSYRYVVSITRKNNHCKERLHWFSFDDVVDLKHR